MEAISHAGTALGVLASDGIVLAAEKKITSKLLEPAKSSEKMYMIDDHVRATARAAPHRCACRPRALPAHATRSLDSRLPRTRARWRARLLGSRRTPTS